jgi:hypothetical protein
MIIITNKASKIKMIDTPIKTVFSSFSGKEWLSWDEPTIRELAFCITHLSLICVHA